LNIDKAIDRIRWRYKNGWKVNETDVEAFNSILEYKELQESISLEKNSLLAKMWIHQLILLNETEMYSAERAIQVIDEILEKDTYDWIKKLTEQTNIMRFNTLLSSPEYKEALDNGQVDKAREIGRKTIDKKADEMLKALKQEVSEDKIIRFVERQINRVLTKFEK